MQPNQEKRAERDRQYQELGPQQYAKDLLGIGTSQFQKYEKAFGLMDITGDGSITKKEFFGLLDKFKLGQSLSKDDVNQLFDRLDKRGSGELSGEINFREFIESLDRKNPDKALSAIIQSILTKEEDIKKERKKLKKSLSGSKSPTGSKSPSKVKSPRSPRSPKSPKSPKKAVKTGKEIMSEVEMSREDYKKYKKVFKSIDQADRRFFDRTDFEEALYRYPIWTNCSVEYIYEIYSKLDKNEEGNITLLLFLQNLKKQDNKEFIVWINVLLYLLEAPTTQVNGEIDIEKLIQEATAKFLKDMEDLREIIRQRDQELEEYKKREAKHLQDLEESNKIIKLLRSGSNIEDVEYEKLSFQEKIKLFNKDFSKKEETLSPKKKKKSRKGSSNSSSSSKSGSGKLDGLKQVIEELEKELAASRLEVTNTQNEKTQLEANFQEINQEVIVLRQQLAGRNEEAMKAQGSVGETHDQHKCQEEIDRLNQIIESLKEQLNQTVSKEEYERLILSEENFAKEVAALKLELERAQTEKGYFERNEAGFTNIIVKLKEQVKSSYVSHGRISQESEDSLRREAELREEIEKLNYKISIMVRKEDFEAARQEAEALRKENSQLILQINELRIRIEEFSQGQGTRGMSIREEEYYSKYSKYSSFEEYYQMYMACCTLGSEHCHSATCHCSTVEY